MNKRINFKDIDEKLIEKKNSELKTYLSLRDTLNVKLDVNENIIKILNMNPGFFLLLSKEQQNDIKLINYVVSLNYCLYNFLDDDLKNNVDIASKLVEKHPCFYQYLTDKMKDDDTVFRKAFEAKPRTFLLNQKFQKSYLYSLEFCKRDIDHLKYIDTNILKLKQFRIELVTHFIEKKNKPALKILFDNISFLSKDVELAIYCTRKNINNSVYFDNSIKRNRKFLYYYLNGFQKINKIKKQNYSVFEQVVEAVRKSEISKRKDAVSDYFNNVANRLEWSKRKSNFQKKVQIEKYLLGLENNLYCFHIGNNYKIFETDMDLRIKYQISENLYI